MNTSHEVEETNSKTRPLPFANDPRYPDLLAQYQNGDWDASDRLVNALLADYPEDPSLLDFRQEISVKQALQKSSEETDKVERRQQMMRTFGRIGIFLLIIILLGGITIFAVGRFRDQLASSQLAAEREATLIVLDAKYDNAENYLQAGRAASALGVLEEIAAIDPEYKDTQDLIATAEALMAIEDDYQHANQLFTQGELAGALSAFKTIQSRQPEYKDTVFKINEIEEDIEIKSLLDQINSSFDIEDYETVIIAYEKMIDLDPTTDISGLEEKLFVSYLNLIIQTADRVDVTVEDVDQAQAYYRSALALLPQNKEYAREREQLQDVANSLIANKYYLFAVDLLETQGYSSATVDEVLRLLKLADNVGTGSPAITAAIERVELYATGLDAINSGKLDEAIDQLEALYRLEPKYADGMVQYLLFEAYMARGDILFTYGDFAAARSDYEIAETYAWGDYGNPMRLFEIETRIGLTLKRLFVLQDAAEYYHYAFSVIKFEDLVNQAGSDQLVTDFQDAKIAYARNDEFNATRLYESVIDQISSVYSYHTVKVIRGQSVYEIAFANGSTAQAIQLANDLGISTIFKTEGEILVPYIPEN